MADTNTSSTAVENANRRLASLRNEVPDVVVQIDSVRADDTAIAVKATIGLPGGARNTDITAIDVDPGRSWAEQHDIAYATAINRALDGLGIPTQQPQAANPPTPGASAMQRVEGDHLSEYSWTSFWQAARARNITREQVEQALGRSVQQATPRDAVDALQAADMWG